jgi:hypothetical protein
MAFAVTNDFTGDTLAVASKVNTNFTDIETELNAFPTNGTLSDNAVTTGKIANDAVTFAKLGCEIDEDNMATDSNARIPTQQSVKAYVDNSVGSANYTPTSYANEESVTYPNGLIIKMGEKDCATAGNYTVTYGTAFPTRMKSVGFSQFYNNNTNPSAWNIKSITGTNGKEGFVFRVNGTYAGAKLYWTAIGY